MKIANGKLLGQLDSELELFRKSQNRHNLEVGNSLQQLDHRVNKTENSLKAEAIKDALFRNLEAQVQRLEERCDRLQIEQEKGQIAEQLWKDMEENKFSQLESNLLKVKHLIPRKLMWLTFGSSLIVGTVSLCSWLNIFPWEPKPNEARYRPTYSSALESATKRNRELIKQIK